MNFTSRRQLSTESTDEHWAQIPMLISVDCHYSVLSQRRMLDSLSHDEHEELELVLVVAFVDS